jgi:hypothetical protein
MQRQPVLRYRRERRRLTNGARIYFNQPLSAALLANANSEVIAPDQLRMAA